MAFSESKTTTNNLYASRFTFYLWSTQTFEHSALFKNWVGHSTIYQLSQTNLIAVSEQSAVTEREQKNTMVWKERLQKKKKEVKQGKGVSRSRAHKHGNP